MIDTRRPRTLRMSPGSPRYGPRVIILNNTMSLVRRLATAGALAIAASGAIVSARSAPGFAAGPAGGSLLLLCNESSHAVVARYRLARRNGAPLSIQQTLPGLAGHANDPSTCLPAKIPKYAGPVVVTGSLDGRRFSQTTLNVAYGVFTYVWYYDSRACSSKTTSYKVCLVDG